MRTYRAYLLDEAGKIRWAEWIEASDLPAAEAAARELCKEGLPMIEVWTGAKRLSDVPCAADEPVVRTSAGVAEAEQA